jgi:hypothetical protein
MDEERPSRYVVSDSGGDGEFESPECDDGVEWMDRVAERVHGLIPDGEAKRRFARREVGMIETANLRRGNKYLRDLGANSQLDLGLLGCMSYPVSVCHRIVKEGERSQTRVVRVRIESLTSSDLRVFAESERRRAAKDFAVRNETCEAAERLADEVDECGARTVREWWDERTKSEEADA